MGTDSKMYLSVFIFGFFMVEGLQSPENEKSEKTGSIVDFSEKEFAYLERVNQIAGNIKAVLDMEKAYADIDLEKLDEDLDIDADGLMEELSDLLMKELTGLDLDSDDLGEDSDVENSDDGANDPSTAELPFEQCSGEDCDSKLVTDDKLPESDEGEDNSIIEADSSEEVARAIAASVLRLIISCTMKNQESIKWNKSLLNSYLILLQVFMSSTKSFIFMPKVIKF